MPVSLYLKKCKKDRTRENKKAGCVYSDDKTKQNQERKKERKKGKRQTAANPAQK